MNNEVNVPDEAVEVMAEILCAWDYRDDSGQTWPTLSDVGRDSFRIQATQLLEGGVPDRDRSAVDLIRSQERQRAREALEEPVHALASSIGRARVLIRNQGGDHAEDELAHAAAAMGRLRTALNAQDPEQPALSEGVGSGADGQQRLREAEAIIRECDSPDGFCGEMPDELRERIQVFLGDLATCPDCGQLQPVVGGNRFGDHLDARAGAEAGAPVRCVGFGLRPPPPQAVQGETCKRCGGSRQIARPFGLHGFLDPEPCPDCQPEKGGEG